MKRLKFILFCVVVAMLLPVRSMAQQRNKQVTIEVTSLEGDNLEGQPLTVTHLLWQTGYGSLKLDSQGRCTLKVYPGEHLVELVRSGFEPVSQTFTVDEDDDQISVPVKLVEKTRTPFGLAASVDHDPFTAANNVTFSWNNETPAFFDDFESYTPFAIAFGEWTGIDGDRETTGSIVGSYPNRGLRQYAQIMSPLDVEPTWWYDMPTLRPYSGRQYVGFIRTQTGRASDDWLISPAIEVGPENVLSFLAKAADIYKENFMVYVTTKIDNPETSDFTRLDKGTYESVSNYSSWERFTYDLSSYDGETIKFAIRYVSNPQTTGAFMLMLDDVYVGSTIGLKRMEVSRKNMPLARRSPDNPYETFEVFLDGEKVRSVIDYSVVLSDVVPGNHTLGVRACYTNTQSTISEIALDIPADDYAKVIVNVTSNSVLPASAAKFELLSKETSGVIDITADDNGRIILNSLPKGAYQLGVAEGAFNAIIKDLDITGDTEVTVELDDHIISPYNITADIRESGETILRWNRDLGFCDSFEDYPDFATGTFGDWVSIDKDGMPVYPISLNGNIIAWPGSGSDTNPQPSAPMIFNPWKTEPPMLPADPAIEAPTGEKCAVFFSTQLAASDKWLITPLLTIREGFLFTMTAKAYSGYYPESMEICVSDGSTNPDDFTPIAMITELSSPYWSQYIVDLDKFSGQEVRLAIHYTSTDAFLALVDDVRIGPDEDKADSIDYGNVISYEIFMDGDKIGESNEPEFTIAKLEPGEHTIHIVAVYRNGRSEPGVYVISSAGVESIVLDADAPTEYFDIMGRRISHPSKGVTIKRQGKNITKLIN